MEVFSTALEELEVAFNRKLKAEQVEYWHKQFGELNEQQWVKMVSLAIRSYDHFPSIASMYRLKLQLPHRTKIGFDWDEKSLFWEETAGGLKARVVPRGYGNTKPNVEYPDLSEEQRLTNIDKVHKIICWLKGEMSYGHHT